MKDFFWPGAATGLPWASKPFRTAVSSAEPGTGLPFGVVSCVVGVAGPGRLFERPGAAAAG